MEKGVTKLGWETKPVYRLEPGDDMPDLMSALREAPELMAIFVDHPMVPVLKNRVNLRLLQDYATEAHRQLVIISSDPLVQSLAGELEIECHGSEAQLAAALGVLGRDSEAGPELEKPGSPWIDDADPPEPLVSTSLRRPALQRWLVLAVAVLAVGILYYALTPKVTVFVTPQLLIYQQTIELLGVGPDATNVEIGNLPVLPLQPVKAVLETEATVSATGSQTIGTGAAQGVAVFINESDQAVTVPKGAELHTGSGVVFRTDAAVTVPSRSTEYFLDVAAGVRAGQEEVRISAVEKGEQGNVAAGRIREFGDSRLAASLAVRNPDPTRGGASVQQMIVTEDDIKKAETICQRQAHLRAGEILQGKVGQSGSVLILESVSIEQTALEPSVDAGSEGQAVHVLTRFETQGQAFRRKDLGEVLQQELERKLPPDLVLYRPKFEIERLVATPQEQIIALEADVKIPVHRRLVAGDLARLLVGLRLQDVGELAKALDAESIVVEPLEVDRLPRFAHWIKVEVGVPEAAVAITQP